MNIKGVNPLDYRKPEHPVDHLFVKRWSARAMSGKSLDHDRLLSLFEAARWAPSAANKQEWYFLYAHRDTEQFNLFWSFLNEG
ncbi:MAG: nitroreductase family protein, partial [Anaerolineaceae bacterium]|nr:nitroreductase family protein [Anaerolineaceae bacterium]